MAEVKPNKQINEVVAEVMNILNHIDKAKIAAIGGDKLTEIAIRLAEYKAYLGSEVAELSYQLNMMEAVREGVWADLFAQAKANGEPGGKPVTDTGARTFADRGTAESKMEEIELGRKFNKIKNLRQDIGDLITTIQSRIGHLKQERMDAMLPNIQP